MSEFHILLLISCLIVVTRGTPIHDGEDVGRVHVERKRTIVTGQDFYPYMVNIKIVEKKTFKNQKFMCAGIIIGKKTVLTAAHCILDKHNPTIYVHAGFVDRKLEDKKGQTIKVTNMLAHDDYRSVCRKKDGKCCFPMNDIAILWLEREFDFGPTVQIAKLGSSLDKPIYETGWILGWGLNSFGKLPAMLQRGKVTVAPERECDEVTPRLLKSESIICVRPLQRATRASSGDSGGPLVIDKMVYGLSSITAIAGSCQNQPIDIYTFIPAYTKWIRESQRIGLIEPQPYCVIC